MDKNLKIIVGIIVATFIIWGGASLFGGFGGNVNDGPVQIGAILPLTGEAATYGEPLKEVVNIAVDEVNEEGGINGRDLEVVYEDGECSGSAAASAMQKLVNMDNIKVILGGFCSSESLAAAPIADKEEVLLLSPGSSSPYLTDISRFFARTYPSDATQGRVLADLAYEDKGWEKVAFIVEQLDDSVVVYESFANRFEELSGEEVVKEEFSRGATDFRSQLTKLQNEEPNALFVSVQTSSAAQKIFKQMKELDWRPPLMLINAISDNSEIIEEFSDFLEGALTAQFEVSGNEKFRNLLNSYSERTGNTLPHQSYAQTTYDAVHLLADGMREVGYNPSALADWVRNVEEWEGASGTVDIQQNGDPKAGHVPKIIKDGEVQRLR